ncbi:MAG: Gfo/Idh/MocA family oxidoreductase, partial [Bacteroidota bacterium]
VGLIGYGLSGRYLQAPFFATHPGFKVVRVLTSREAELRERFPDLSPSKKVEDILGAPAIDLVAIATPNATHYDLARAALEAGKHVLVDKPACPTARQVRELRDLAATRKRHLFVFQNRRWDSDFLTVKQVLNSGVLGQLVSYEARYDRWKPAPNAKAWKETPGPGAGMLYDLGAHLIDQAIALFGIPIHISGSSWKQRSFSTIPDAFDLLLAYESGLRAKLSCSLLVREPTPRYRLNGDLGSYLKYGIDIQEDQLKAGLQPNDPGFGTEPEGQMGILHTDAGRVTYPTLPGRWLHLFENIHQVVTAGATSAVPLEEIIAQLEMIESVQKQ